MGNATEIYIEALLVDEELADHVWDAWEKGEIDDLTACKAWILISRTAAMRSKADIRLESVQRSANDPMVLPQFYGHLS